MNDRRASPSFEDLHLLTIVAESRSFTQAARRLGISKASVSTRVSELERSAGIPLVRRSTRAIVLTPAAIQLVEETRSSFARIEESFVKAKDLAGTPRGLVRVSAPVALGRQYIGPSLPEFLTNYPEIRVELDVTDRLVNLTQEGFDLAVRHSNTAPETNIAHALCESRSLLMASPEYLKRSGVPEHPADLSRHSCLLYLREEGVQNWSFEKIVGRRKTERVSIPVSGPLRANNSEILREAVLKGVGLGLLPDFSGLQERASGRIVQVLSDWRPVGFFGARLYAVRPWSPKPPRAVQLLIDHLRTLFAGGFETPIDHAKG